MRTLILPALLVLTACVTSPVVTLEDGSYLISMHTGWGLMPHDTLIEKTAVKAQAFCAQRGQDALIKNSLATGLPILTSQNANVVFTCVAPKTP